MTRPEVTSVSPTTWWDMSEKSAQDAAWSSVRANAEKAAQPNIDVQRRQHAPASPTPVKVLMALSTSKTTSIGMHAPFVYGGAVMERREAEIAKSIVASCDEWCWYFKQKLRAAPSVE